MWTPEQTKLLATRWRHGYSAGLIARELGSVSRNAVIGKAMRLGLPKRRSSLCIKKTPEIASAKTVVQKRTRYTSAENDRASVMEMASDRVSLRGAAARLGVSLHTFRMCFKWYSAVKRAARRPCKWRANNIEKARESNRKYMRKWRAANPEENKKRAREHYAANRENRLGYSKKYNAANMLLVAAARAIIPAEILLKYGVNNRAGVAARRT